MTTVNCASILCAILGFAFGLAAACYWYKSAQVNADPEWKTALDEPVDTEDKNSQWTAALLKWAAESARLNRTAAILTAIAVFFGAVASVLGSLSVHFR